MDGDYYEAPLLWPRQHIHGDAVIHSTFSKRIGFTGSINGTSVSVSPEEKFEVK